MRVHAEDVGGDANLHGTVVPRRGAGQRADGEKRADGGVRYRLRRAGDELRTTLLELVHHERRAVEAVVFPRGAQQDAVGSDVVGVLNSRVTWLVTP